MSHRDFFGYGAKPPKPDWPDDAYLAVSLVINLEEGAEPSIAMGDDRNEAVYEVVDEVVGFPDLCMESHYEYGTRVAIWRLLDLLDVYGIKATINVSARVFELSPWLAEEVVARGHEVCAHGYRWIPQYHMAEAEERAMIAQTVQVIESAAGVRPVGWKTRSSCSMNTRRLLVEHGGFIYDSDSYNDDCPYIVQLEGRHHIVLPYSFDSNDMRFAGSETFRLARDFTTYLIDSFNWLWQEGQTVSRMMTIGLHPRIIGRSGRIVSLKEFLDYATGKGRIWFARRDEIAHHWRSRFNLVD